MSRSIRVLLCSATCSLMSSEQAVQASTDPDWQVNTESTVLSEEDRIFTNANKIRLNTDDSISQAFSISFMQSVRTGLAANGAAVINRSQTMTSPSGVEVVIPSGKLPASKYDEKEYGLSVSMGYKFLDRFNSIWEVLHSRKYDQYSWGGGSFVEYHLPNKKTIVKTGVILHYDYIEPSNGVPYELYASWDNDRILEVQKKKSVGYDVSLSHDLNSYVSFKLNYFYQHSNGYHSNPYMLISVLDGDTSAPLVGNPYFYEKRPKKRNTNQVKLLSFLRFQTHSLTMKYQYYIDDWQVQSHSLGLFYGIEIFPRNEIQFQWEYAKQHAASFYHYYFSNMQASGVVPEDVLALDFSRISYLRDIVGNASADYQLSDFKSYTVGLAFTQYYINDQGKFTLRFARMNQSDKRNQFADIRTWIFQFLMLFSF